MSAAAPFAGDRVLTTEWGLDSTLEAPGFTVKACFGSQQVTAYEGSYMGVPIWRLINTIRQTWQENERTRREVMQEFELDRIELRPGNEIWIFVREVSLVAY